MFLSFRHIQRRNMVVFTLSLVRHGETGHNKEHIVQGQLDVPLSQTGIHQASLLANHLRERCYTHVYASDLSRAVQTAEEILKRNLVSKVNLIQDARLRERQFGSLQGKNFQLLKEAATNAGVHFMEYTPPGGETVAQMRQRAGSFFLDLCETIQKCSEDGTEDASSDGSMQDRTNLTSCHDDTVGSLPVANVLIVSHGGLILEILRYIFDTLKCQVHKNKLQILRITPNAAISTFEVSVGKNGKPQNVKCLQIHENQYLRSKSNSNDSDVSL